MKYLICYFDTEPTRMFVEKEDEKGNKFTALASSHNFIYKNETAAQAVNVDNPDDVELQVDRNQGFFKIEKNAGFKAGDGIYFDQSTDTFKATEYGFLILDRNTQKIRLITPLQVSKDKTKAYYIIQPTRSEKIPVYRDIEETLAAKKIIAIIGKEEIEEQLNSINVKAAKVNRIVVARGQEPVTGYDEYMVPLIKLEKKAGRELEDGRIDFKEVDSIIEIKKGQEILKKIPGVKSADGLTVYGDKISGAFERKEGYIKGDNLVDTGGPDGILVSDIDGCLLVEGKKVSVSPYALVKGNVDYDSGNLDFNGSVHILGSVLPGFSVKARGDIIIDKNADDSYIEAEGDVIVKQGIGGKGDMKIIAGGKVKVEYVLNASVEAVKEIEVQDSIINSRVFSNDKVSVTAKHGKIIGGETTARHEIIANVAGVPTENLTVLTVGVSLFVERELVEIRKEIESCKARVNETMLKIRTSFGEELFEDPKKFLSILPPLKKKQCLVLLSDLTGQNKELKELNQRREEAELKLKLDRDPAIMIMDTVFPGTIINVKKRRRRIDEKLVNVKFYEDPELKEVRYTAAL